MGSWTLTCMGTILRAPRASAPTGRTSMTSQMVSTASAMWHSRCTIPLSAWGCEGPSCPCTRTARTAAGEPGAELGRWQNKVLMPCFSAACSPCLPRESLHAVLALCFLASSYSRDTSSNTDPDHILPLFLPFFLFSFPSDCLPWFLSFANNTSLCHLGWP